MKKIYRQHIVEALQELADRQTQERRWLSSGPPEVSSFTEAMERLFSDSGLGDALESGETSLGGSADSILRRLRKKLQTIDESAPPSVIIDGTEMEEIRDLALEALRALKDNP